MAKGKVGDLFGIPEDRAKELAKILQGIEEKSKDVPDTVKAVNSLDINPNEKGMMLFNLGRILEHRNCDMHCMEMGLSGMLGGEEGPT